MFSVLVIRLRSLRLLRVSGIVMRLRMFLLLITFLKASHSFRSEERFSRNAETDLVCRLLLEKKKNNMNFNDHADQAYVPLDRSLYTRIQTRESRALTIE